MSNHNKKNFVNFVVDWSQTHRQNVKCWIPAFSKGIPKQQRRTTTVFSDA